MKQLYTPWGENLDRNSILQEYPRPALVRDSYINLNGTWNYAICKQETPPASFDGEICVPFSPEAALSGVMRQLQPDEFLWYQRDVSFVPDEIAQGNALLLHFGAIDQSATIFINGTEVSSHFGGYLPFTVDITPFLSPCENSFSLLVRVKDVSDTSYHSRGKQKLQRGGMYYTAQSGIWQTVWMEYVPACHVNSIEIVSSSDDGRIAFSVSFEKTTAIDRQLTESLPFSLEIYPPVISDNIIRQPKDCFEKFLQSNPILSHTDMLSSDILEQGLYLPLCLDKKDCFLWDTNHPYLYSYRLQVGNDVLAGYFARRTFSKEPDENGIMRICLNHKPIFLRGVLDQGYWPDGLMTAPDDAAFLFDISQMKKCGYNMIRKHIKIEPQRFYYHCDRLGMVVWQDMVNGGSTYKDWYVTYFATVKSCLFLPSSDRWSRLLSRGDIAGKYEWKQEMLATIQLLKNHPCIGTWVIFNEGWGQFDTQKMVELAYQKDASRLIDATSGWYDQNTGDMNSYHNYFFPLHIPQKAKKNRRVTVLSEFGGYSMAIPKHCTGEAVYGYGTYKTQEALQKAFDRREAEVQALIPQGLCASVYTQLSDIEDEVNGIFTYDRKIQKLH